MTTSPSQEHFIKLPKWRWRNNLATKTTWTLDELYIHLAFCADERMFAAAPFPSRRALMRLTGITEAKVRRALANHRRWVPADRLAQWEQTMIEDGRIKVAKAKAPEEQRARKEEDKLHYVRPPRQRRRTGYDDEQLGGEIGRRMRHRNWSALRGQDPVGLLDAVRRVLTSVLERAPTPVEVSNDRWCILGALRGRVEAAPVGADGSHVVDIEGFITEVALVARAARDSNQHIFRGVRGMIGGEQRYPDRSHDARFLLYGPRWAERVAAAATWSKAADAPVSAGGHAFDDMQRILRADQDPKAVWSVDMRLAADDAENMRRREALVTALYHCDVDPLVENIASPDPNHVFPGVRTNFIRAYTGPPPPR